MVQANVGQKLMPINLIVRLNMYLTVMFRYFSTYNEWQQPDKHTTNILLTPPAVKGDFAHILSEATIIKGFK